METRWYISKKLVVIYVLTKDLPEFCSFTLSEFYDGGFVVTEKLVTR